MEGKTPFQSKKYPQFFIRDATEEDNSQLLNLVAETMPSNGMVLSFERFPSYFQATHVQYNRPEIKAVYLKDNPEKIIAMMNVGFKDYYINRQCSELRYVSDLRIHSDFRGKKAMDVLMEYVYTEISTETIFQSVVLADNHIARHILHQSREGFPEPYIYDQITTYTISKVPKAFNSDRYQIVRLNLSLIPQANAFIQEMSQFYNFLAPYDFNDLITEQHPFWTDMKIEDFSLVVDQKNKVVGLMGLWDQKKIKQTKVDSYSKAILMLRPFYNFWAKLSKNILLPKPQDSFDYLMAHSVLCDPNRSDVFKFQLAHLTQQTHLKSKSSFCITLSDDDPRKKALDPVESHKMKAIHSFHSFNASPVGKFDRAKISYFEVGRL